jgi:hypothetical protein
MKLRLLGTELFVQADRQTDMTQLIVTSRNFSNCPSGYIQFVFDFENYVIRIMSKFQSR